MGRIIRNVIEYGSGNENATNINYDGTVSGLEATTVQEAIDEVVSGLGGLEFTIVDGKPQWKERGADSFNPFSQSLYVYNKGVKKVPYTVFANYQNSGTITENTDNITIRSAGNNVTLHWEIDITAYDYLILNWTGGRFDTYIGIGTNNANNEWCTTNSGVHMVDVSNKTGIKTIFLDAWDNGTTASVSHIILL